MYIYAVNIDKTVDFQGELYFSRIAKTVYMYTADEKSIKIYKDDIVDAPELKFEFKGNYIGKKCVFRIDHKDRFKFLGEAKPPKDPIKKLFWDHEFTGARRFKSIEEFNKSVISEKEWFENGFSIPSVETQEKAKEYFKHILTFIRDTTDNNSIKKKDYYGDFHLTACGNNPIVLHINTKNKSWWASEDLTLDEAQLILNEMV